MNKFLKSLIISIVILGILYLLFIVGTAVITYNLMQKSQNQTQQLWR